MSVTSSNITHNLRLPGQYYDQESGLHQNYFRDYDPSIGRYLQSDPIGLYGGTNTYGYVGNNPLRYIDPLGLAYQDKCGCFAKAFLGYAEAGVALAHASTGPYVNKPRGGIAGGGRAGSKTSALSIAIHQVNKRHGKSTATAAARTAGRIASRAVPYVGTALLIYDITVFIECMKECEEDECQQ